MELRSLDRYRTSKNMKLGDCFVVLALSRTAAAAPALDQVLGRAAEPQPTAVRPLMPYLPKKFFLT